MDSDNGSLTAEIFKWVGIVFVTGFIGYFGRYLAKIIIGKMRRDKAQPAPAPSPRVYPSNAGDNRKLAKKQAKASAKQAKKAVKE